MAVVAAAPARIPLHAGGQQANLLVPLYGVLIAIALAHAYTLAAGARAAARRWAWWDGRWRR